MIDRRELLLGLGAFAACTHVSPKRPSAPIDPLAVARGAAAYIRRHRIETPQGLTWEKSPDEPGVRETDLYHGSAGVALFFVELHRATGDRAALDEAARTVAHAVAAIPEKLGPFEVGYQGGVAGLAFVADTVAKATDDPAHHAWLARILGRLEQAAPSSDRGRATFATDVLYGGAGIVLSLLSLAASDERALPMAIGFGDGLLARAEAAGEHKHWLMIAGDKRELPNFSHGTAGVAYALARLYEVTKQQRFLDAAIAGAEFLVDIAFKDGNVFLVPHSIPDGKERYYLAYCHGPAGTARLFHQLHAVTRDAKWAALFDASINGVLEAGIPEQRSPGYWDNVGQCCGTAAIGELALTLHRLRGDAWYRRWADQLAADIASRATRGAGGELEWVHAENRAEPYWKQSYTGYMQGASGIGSLFIRLAAHDASKPWKVRLPDNPWAI